MSNIYVTFGGRAFDSTTRLIVERARDFGADEVRVYDDAWLLKTEYYEWNKWLFERRPAMGFGWCCWKPFVIALELNQRKPGDVVLYTDADTYPIAHLGAIFEETRRSQVMLFEEQGCIHRQWTRRACFGAMGVPWQPDEVLACGRFQAFHAGWPFWRSFLNDWQRYSTNADCQFHDVDKATDPEVIRHSAEQSVLSVLALKWQIERHRCPDQAGWPVAHNGTYKPLDYYPQLFIQDGNRGDTSDLRGSRYRNV